MIVDNRLHNLATLPENYLTKFSIRRDDHLDFHGFQVKLNTFNRFLKMADPRWRMDPDLSLIINDVIKKSQLSSYRLITF